MPSPQCLPARWVTCCGTASLAVPLLQDDNPILATEPVDVPAFGDELQYPHRHLLFFHRIPGPRRRDRRTSRRLGYSLFRGPRRARLSRSAAFGGIPGGRTRAQLPDSLAQRNCPHSQGDARFRGPGEHASFHARVVGPLLDLRPQRRPARVRAGARRQLPARRPNGQ